MEELLNFKYQDKELCLFYEKQTPIYGKRENGIVSYDLTDEEKRLINSVYCQVMPSSKIERRSDIKLNGTTIAHFVDKRKDIHMFYEIKDNKVNILDKQLRIIFNNMFNNQNEYVISPSKPKTPNKKDGFFKRLIKIGKKTAIAFVASSIILGASYINPTIAKADENNTKLEEFGEELEKYQGIKHGLEKVYDDFDSLDKERIFDLTYKYPELLNKKLIVKSKVGTYIATLGVYFLEFDLMSEDYLEHHEEIEASDELEKELQSLFPGRSVSVTAKKTVTLTYDDILKLLNDNPNLSKEEIEALLTPDFIKDNLKYMDHNYIQKMAQNLFMTYIPDNNS